MLILFSFGQLFGKVESCLDEEFQIIEEISLPWNPSKAYY